MKSQNHELKILGFLLNLPLSERGVSGTRSILTHHLKRRGYVHSIVDVECNSALKKLMKFRNIDYNIYRWLFKNDIDIATRYIQSKLAERRLTYIDESFNSCLQIGSMFNINDITKLNNIKKFSYHDNNLMALLKSSSQSYTCKKKISKAYHFEKKVYDGLDAIFTMTAYLKNSFVDDFYIPENKVYNVGFGVNISYEDYKKDFDCKTIIFVAKDSFYKKGGGVVVKAFKKAKKYIKDAKLLLVGQNLRINEDGIEVIGFLDKRNPQNFKMLKAIYQQASLFVMPSPEEAAGNVFLEAMAHKTPCIGADRGSTPEIICNNNCGDVIKPGSADELSEKMIYFLNNKDLLKEMGENGFYSIKKYYNWDAVCGNIVNIMKQYL